MFVCPKFCTNSVLKYTEVLNSSNLDFLKQCFITLPIELFAFDQEQLVSDNANHFDYGVRGFEQYLLFHSLFILFFYP